MLTVYDLLESWGMHGFNIPLSEYPSSELIEIPIHEATEWVELTGSFDRSSTALVRPGVTNSGGRIRIAQFGSPEPLRDNKICIIKASSDIHLTIGGSGNRFYLGNFGHKFVTEVICYEASMLAIGDRATSNGCRQFLVRSDTIIGVDAMLSDGITLQSSDQHGIVDLTTGKIINTARESLLIGRHAWVGRGAMVLPGCSIGEGAIVGAASVVTGNIEPFSACAGVPAKLIRRDVSWIRRPSTISPYEAGIFENRTLKQIST